MPKNLETISFSVHSEKLKILISQNLLSKKMKTLKTFNLSNTSLVDTKCSVVCVEGGAVFDIKKFESLSKNDGVKLLKFVGKQDITDDDDKNNDSNNNLISDSNDLIESESNANANKNNDNNDANAVNNSNNYNNTNNIVIYNKKSDKKINKNKTTIELISYGEIMLEKLRQLLENSGIKVEFRLSLNGGVLICNEQILIRKGNENDFLVEGPPLPVFYEVRKVLYQLFEFV
jgi:hypothetical protein